MALQPGEILNDRYRIVRIIKSGGMGSVYEAIDTKLADSPCAVKEIHEAAQASRDAEYIQGRFFEEMKALVALDHNSIPKVRDYLQQNGTIYIVMELVQGRSLEEEIQERTQQEAPPPVDYIVLDMVRLLETLAYLHGQDPPVIHRDIKPANILRDQRSGTIKLVDFGLARTLAGPNTQTVVGTMGYCAPEQLMGKSEQRSDLYAVGVTMVHMLTGKAPEMELFEARRPDLPGVRPGLADIIARATQPKPQDRYASAQEMVQALQAWLHQPSTTVVTPWLAPPKLPEPPPRTVPGWAGKLAAVSVVLACLGLGVWAGQRHKPPPASRALMPTPEPTPGVAAQKGMALLAAHKKVIPPMPEPVAERAEPVYYRQPVRQAAPVYRQPVRQSYTPPRRSYTPPRQSYTPPPRAQSQRVYHRQVEQYVRQEARREVRRNLPSEVRNIPLPF